MLNVIEWGTLLLTPITGVVTYFAGARKRKLQTVEQMQQTIDMLVQKNAELYTEVVKLRAEVAKIKSEQRREKRWRKK